MGPPTRCGVCAAVRVCRDARRAPRSLSVLPCSWSCAGPCALQMPARSVSPPRVGPRAARMPVCSVSSLSGFLGPLPGFLGPLPGFLGPLPRFLGPLPAGQLVGCRLSWRVNPGAMRTPARSVSSPRVGPCTAPMPVSSVSSLSRFLGPLPCVLQLCAANPRPVTNPGAMGVLLLLSISCHRGAAAVAARFLLQLLCCSSLQPTPAPVPI